MELDCTAVGDTNNRLSGTCLSGSRLNVVTPFAPTLEIRHSPLRAYRGVFRNTLLRQSGLLHDRQKRRAVVAAFLRQRGVFSSPEVPSPSGVAHSRRNLSSPPPPPVVASFCRSHETTPFSAIQTSRVYGAERECYGKARALLLGMTIHRTT